MARPATSDPRLSLLQMQPTPVLPKAALDILTSKGLRLRGGTIPSRLEKIFRINMRTARAAEQWTQLQKVKQAMPFLIYEMSSSIERRDLHLSWVGTILPVDDPWWHTHFPPNGWNCKCRVRQITTGEAGRLGGKTKAPKDTFRETADPRTGEVIRVPNGIDVGWDFNPGAERTLGLNRSLVHTAEIAAVGKGVFLGVGEAGRQEIAHGFVGGYLHTTGFQEFVRTAKRAVGPPHDNAVPVAIMPLRVLKRSKFKTERRTVEMSGYTAAKQRGEIRGKTGHPDVTAADY